ncbi:inositol 1,4,5-trisphosphate receptor-interacting protein-like 1 [Porphyrio hochstetteri]
MEWSFWTFTFCGGVLILLQRWKNTKTRSHQQGSPRRQSKEWEDEEAEDDELDNDSDDACYLGRYEVDSIQWPVSPMDDTCKLVEELVDHLLTACRRLSRNTFKPWLQPAIGLDCGYEHSGSWDDNVFYRLLVPLQPPPGHTFSIELKPNKNLLTRNSCIHVQLDCMCMREQLVGDMLCFVHHSRRELARQDPSLLKTLCSKSYLDIEKTTCWFQQLVKAAWNLLPFSHRCQLTVLPTTRSCKIRLTAGQEILTIEMTFGVMLDNSGSYLSLE